MPLFEYKALQANGAVAQGQLEAAGRQEAFQQMAGLGLRPISVAEKAGQYDVEVHLTKARDYGIVELSLDGQKLGRPTDLYNPDVRPAAPIGGAPMELKAGEHKLTIEIVGANEKAVKRYLFGLDEVVLEPK